jgi:hypothetical protein
MDMHCFSSETKSPADGNIEHEGPENFSPTRKDHPIKRKPIHAALYFTGIFGELLILVHNNDFLHGSHGGLFPDHTTAFQHHQIPPI